MGFPSSAATLVELLEQRAEGCDPTRGFQFLEDGERVSATLSFTTLAVRARAIAARLAHLAPGDRALLVYPPGPDFVQAFFGALDAGVPAVPVYPPHPARPAEGIRRLAAILRDAWPRAILTVLGLRDAILALHEELPELAGIEVIATDEVPDSAGAQWRPPPLRPESLAFLQYTSGSTGQPKGTMVSHANLLGNVEMIRRAFDLSPSMVGVSWLPLYHDMGLIGGALLPLYLGARCVFMSPVDFLQRPLNWMRAMSTYQGTLTAAPNFGYELCERRCKPEEIAALDLRAWRGAVVSAEPIRAATLRRFTAKFAPAGFDPTAYLPCYGMAEATLLVTGAKLRPQITTLCVRRGALERRRAELAEPGGPDALELVGCGAPAPGVEVAIVEPDTGRRLADGEVGEIWIQGPSVAAGYAGQPEVTARQFQARPADASGAYLRSGDLGFTWEGELYFSGRCKDLIVIHGRNIYPQDVELTVEGASPLVRAGCAAAFSVDGEAGEELVVVAELDRRVLADRRGADAGPVAGGELRAGSDRRREGDPLSIPPASPPSPVNLPEIAAGIRAVVAAEHGLSARVILAVPGALPKTSSGKIQRFQCRSLYLEQRLQVLAG